MAVGGSAAEDVIDSFQIVGAGADVAGGGPGGTFLGVSHTEGGHLVKSSVCDLISAKKWTANSSIVQAVFFFVVLSRSWS